MSILSRSSSESAASALSLASRASCLAKLAMAVSASLARCSGGKARSATTKLNWADARPWALRSSMNCCVEIEFMDLPFQGLEQQMTPGMGDRGTRMVCCGEWVEARLCALSLLSEYGKNVSVQASTPEPAGGAVRDRFPAGTLARIDAVLDLETNEKRSDLIREAVERELKRRERKV